MIGLDTNILVSRVVPDHPSHGQVCECIDSLLAEEKKLALTSVILSEFIHIVTDAKRFQNPLTMTEALEWAEFWSQAEETVMIHPDHKAHVQWLHWLREHRLGRKRLLDTLIAATWHSAGITEIYTLNPSDFKIFAVFDFVKSPSQ